MIFVDRYCSSRLRRGFLATTLLAGAACFATPVLAADAPSNAAAAPDAAGDDTANQVVVTGNRARASTTINSPAPIQVLGSASLTTLGANTSLRDALSALLPSFAEETESSSSWTSILRPASLRGLGGAHVLVLVDGKRRHPSSLNSSFQTDAGANEVDLDLIPPSAIDHIEVLTDGAAAQYGSDAIAGVINIILKSDHKGGDLSFSAGQRYQYLGHTDGRNLEANVHLGFKLGDDGFINFSALLRDNERATRAVPATGALYYPLANGEADPRNATANRYLYAGGLPEIRQGSFLYKAELPLTDGTTTLYSSSTYDIRSSIVGQNFRRANSTNDILAIYPDGFAPNYTLHEQDFQTLWGIRGNNAGWKWDLSSTYGENHGRNGASNTLNAALGPDSPTSFTTFTALFAQWTNNLDVSKSFDIGLAQLLQFSFGAEHRYERYQTISGDPLSYATGDDNYPTGYVYPTGTGLSYPNGYGVNAGQHATVGAQGAITLTPSDQADLHRNSFAVYGDVGLNPTPKWFTDVAGRFEHYDDSAGNTVSGKFTTRYDFSKAFALRGTVSNGFRAPSLAQEGYAQTSNQYTSINGVAQYVVSKVVTPTSALGQALGAQPLKPEKSLNISFGSTLKLGEAFTFTADAYQINLDHRIVETGYLTGTGIQALLVADGFSPNYAIRYFSNAINTRTRGLEITANYGHKFDLGDLALSLGYNHNTTAITRIGANPSQIASLGLTLFDRITQTTLTNWTSKDKVILGQVFKTHKLRFGLRETYYGPVSSYTDVVSQDQHFSGKVITDLDISYQLTPQFAIAVGANNLFNIYPDKYNAAISDPSGNGFPPYPAQSPWGIYGGYYYGRVTYSF